MTCKICPTNEIHFKGMCRQCTSDYRYNAYRKWLEKKQIAAGLPISQQWKRKPRWKYEKS